MKSHPDKLYQISPIEEPGSGNIVYKAVNQEGQAIEMGFVKDCFDNLCYWCVYLWIGKRKYGFQFRKQTGKDGLKSLLWAKECMKHFIADPPVNGLKNHILVGWDNGKRRNVYVRGLKELGFNMSRIEKRMWLHKSIN